tara:strand:- start:59 stop:391 length:333 start_codon:yes stop_codon:yes gene_type:complete
MSDVYEDEGVNVVFKAKGNLREMFDHVHTVYGVNKSEQAKYLLDMLVNTKLTGESQLDDYLRIVQGLIVGKLRAKQIDLEWQVRMKQTEIESINIELGGINQEIGDRNES